MEDRLRPRVPAVPVVRAVGALVLAVLAGGAARATAADDATASVFRADSANTGVYRAAAPLPPVWARWSFQTRGPIRGSAAVVDGTVVFGSGDGFLYALDAASGELRWRYRAGGAIASTPAVHGGRVFVADRGGSLHAVRLADGGPVWSARLGEERTLPFGWDHLMSSPALAGEAVVVGSGSGDVVAVDARTGRELWRTPTGGPVRSSPAVHGSTAFVGSADGYLYALAVEDGRVLWRHATEGVSIDLVRWGFDRRTVDSSPAVAGDLVLHGSRDGHLYAVRRSDGSRAWAFDHGLFWVVASPAFDGERVLVGSSDGKLFHALDARSGDELWRYDTPSNVLSSGAVAGGTVVFGCSDGHLFALDAGSGRELWRFLTGGPVVSSPVVAGGRVFVGSDDGRLYALRGRRPVEEGTARAVYWQGDPGFRLFGGGEALRDALDGFSYEVLDEAGLPTFLERAVAGGTTSVVVAADDLLPAVVLEGGRESLLRRYLDAGGRLVQLGLPPDAAVRDGEGRVTGLDPSRTEAILGVRPLRIAGDLPAVAATSEGIAWGVPAWGLGGIAIDPDAVSEVLARDEHGRAAAWVVRFGTAGGAYVQVWGRREAVDDPAWVAAVAEHRLAAPR